MNRRHALEEAQEQAALYALGILSAAEAREFEAHLNEGCDLCARELASFGAVASELGAAAEPVVPSERVRGAVLERVAAPVLEERGLRFVRTVHVPWQAFSQPQIESKPLFSDGVRGYHTQLIRMAPGATYPSHRHVEPEEIYLLEGDLTVSGVGMRAGDYCRAEPASIHDGISTVNGCVFIVLSSERDELLA